MKSECSSQSYQRRATIDQPNQSWYELSIYKKRRKIKMSKINLENLQNEMRNQETFGLDEMSISQAVQLMNKEDQKVAAAVEKELTSIEPVIANTIESFKKGGRLIYMGAGTSGRLGVLDAAECVPTFGVEPEMVIGLYLAGGESSYCSCRRGRGSMS